MLAFVHRMPCREDDSSTAKDLSKVSWKRVPVRSLIVELIKSDNHLFFFSNFTQAYAPGIWRLVCGCYPSEHKLISFTR